ncbi:hypothetical protein KDI_31270 [Dictyobacter arantiisoli]|uniref:Uncharacterized protein n=1 Tax=Dictyobacter arantiisoli TaxID=2014874 RepID=A0A5A5TER3_9CHLR|nr:hypothetical protein KDI_31270 [Dictyobacter arantiisoli]
MNVENTVGSLLLCQAPAPLTNLDEVSAAFEFGQGLATLLYIPNAGTGTAQFEISRDKDGYHGMPMHP